MFKVFDADSSGTISFKELRLAVRALGLEVQQRDIRQLVQSMDLNQNGQIELEEFEALVARSRKKETFVVIVTVTCHLRSSISPVFMVMWILQISRC